MTFSFCFSLSLLCCLSMADHRFIIINIIIIIAISIPLKVGAVFSVFVVVFPIL